jgi:hypothetical protein
MNSLLMRLTEAAAWVAVILFFGFASFCSSLIISPSSIALVRAQVHIKVGSGQAGVSCVRTKQPLYKYWFM